VLLQVFAYTAKKELMIDELCIDTSYRSPLVLQRCHGQGGSQRWLFDKKVYQLAVVFGTKIGKYVPEMDHYFLLCLDICKDFMLCFCSFC